MGYYIRELKNKSQLPHWKIQFITYKKSETQESNAQKPRKEWDVPARLGRQLNAYFEKCGHRTNESEPIFPAQLQKAKPKLKPEHYNWIYLSVWLGLRPREVDQLKSDRFVRLQPGLHKKLILWIYQTKLSAVPPQYRWKLIPIIFSEQEVALKILRS